MFEIEVERFEKKNDSEFYLDEEFYDRMADELFQKENPGIRPIELGDNDKSSNKTEVDDEDDNRGKLDSARARGERPNIGRLMY